MSKELMLEMTLGAMVVRIMRRDAECRWLDVFVDSKLKASTVVWKGVRYDQVSGLYRTWNTNHVAAVEAGWRCWMNDHSLTEVGIVSAGIHLFRNGSIHYYSPAGGKNESVLSANSTDWSS